MSSSARVPFINQLVTELVDDLVLQFSIIIQYLFIVQLVKM